MEHAPPRRPDREDVHNGLAYTLWLPEDEPPWPAVVILHGAGSRKENHADFARLAAASGWAAIAFDQRGHGASEGEMGPEAFDDVSSMASLLAVTPGVDPERIAVRGSSMGGFMAIHAAARDSSIAGVMAICPAGEDHLARGLRKGDFEMRVGDPVATELWLTESDLGEAVEALGDRPLFLMHAEGDDQIPSWHSEQLAERAVEPVRLLLVPGGDHRSLQHDAELQATALAWIEARI